MWGSQSPGFPTVAGSGLFKVQGSCPSMSYKQGFSCVPSSFPRVQLLSGQATLQFFSTRAAEATIRGQTTKDPLTQLGGPVVSLGISIIFPKMSGGVEGSRPPGPLRGPFGQGTPKGLS